MAWKGIATKIASEPAYQHLIICKEKVRPLWDFLLTNNSVTILSYQNSLPSMITLLRTLRNTRLEQAYLLTETPRNYVLAALSGASTTGRQRIPWSSVLNQCIQRPPDCHRSKEYFLLLNPARSFEETQQPLFDSKAELPLAVEEVLHTRCVALFPGAARGSSKRWPYFKELAEALLLENITPLIMGSATDAQGASSISAGKNLCGLLTIPQTVAVINRVMGCVSNDSGGMHLVDGIGTPLIAVFGLTDPSKTGPLSTTSRVLKAPGRSSVSIGARDNKAELALASIPVTTVLEALHSLVR